MPKDGKLARPGIIPVQASSIRAEPHVARPILDDRDHKGVGQVGCTAPCCPEEAVLSCFAIDPRQSGTAPYPNIVLAIRKYATGGGSQHALRIVRIMPVSLERQRVSLKTAPSSPTRAHTAI